MLKEKQIAFMRLAGLPFLLPSEMTCYPMDKNLGIGIENKGQTLRFWFCYNIETNIFVLKIICIQIITSGGIRRISYFRKFCNDSLFELYDFSELTKYHKNMRERTKSYLKRGLFLGFLYLYVGMVIIWLIVK